MLENGTLDHRKTRVWDFDWSDVPRATRYHLYVIGRRVRYPVVHDATLTSSAYQFKEIAYVADLYRLGWRWKVRALVNGVWTDWSEERTFDVAPLGDGPAAPAQK